MELDEPPHLRCVSIIDNDACYILFKTVYLHSSALFHFDPDDHWDIFATSFHLGIRQHILQSPDAHTHVIMLKSFDPYDFVQLRILQVTSKTDLPDVRNDYHWVNFANAITLLEKQYDQNEQLNLMRSYLKSYLVDLQTKPPFFNSIPWYNYQFYRSILSWIETTLKDKRISFSADPEQYYISFRSVIYVIKTNKGIIYFKQGLPRLKEAHCTKIINEIFSQQTPNLIATSSELNRTVQEDFGSTLSDLYYSLTDGDEDFKNYEYGSVFENILCQWALLQKSSAPLVDQLVSKGIPNHDQDWYLNGLKDVFLYAEEKSILSLKELKHLQECGEFLHATLTLWKKSNIPRTVVHGDLIESNVAVKSLASHQFLFFDWEYVHGGYPFVDLQSSNNHPMFKNQLSYLNNCTEYADLQTIMSLAAQSKPLTALTSVITDLRRVTEERNAVELYTYKSNIRWNMKYFIQDVLEVKGHSAAAQTSRDEDVKIDVNNRSFYTALEARRG